MKRGVGGVVILPIACQLLYWDQHTYMGNKSHTNCCLLVATSNMFAYI